MRNPPVLSRRRLLQGAASLALSLPALIPASARGRAGRSAPGERITMACIGLGGEGLGKNVRAFLAQPDAQVVAVCDVDPARLAEGRRVVESHYAGQTRAGSYRGCAAAQDFRELLARRDIDAVMIATPDHWHVPMSVAAMQAGKDVICEKPSLTIQEGRLQAETVRRYGAVFQTSTEDRAIACHHRMAELVRNGRIGRLRRILVGLPGGPDQAGDPTPKPVPPGFDYEMWLGPAPYAPYCPDRVHFNFRWISDYSGGILTDWGAHLLDTAQWANNTEHTGPVEVWGSGRRHPDGLYDTFYAFTLNYRYANGVEMTVRSGGVFLRFEGTAGWVGNTGWLGAMEASSPEILKAQISPTETRLFTCPAGEHRNFLDCVKTRRDPYFPAEIAQRCFTILHIGNIALLLGRRLRWDPGSERFVGDDTANRCLSRASRSPWSLG